MACFLVRVCDRQHPDYFWESWGRCCGQRAQLTHHDGSSFVWFKGSFYCQTLALPQE